MVIALLRNALEPYGATSSAGIVLTPKVGMNVWFLPVLSVIIGFKSLQWHHNEHDGISNHWHLNNLLNPLCRRRSKKTSKLHMTGLCEGNSPTGECGKCFYLMMPSWLSLIRWWHLNSWKDLKKSCITSSVKNTFLSKSIHAPNQYPIGYLEVRPCEVSESWDWSFKIIVVPWNLTGIMATVFSMYLSNFGMIKQL